MTTSLEKHIADLFAVYPSLVVVRQHQEETVLAGRLAFKADRDDVQTISASFDIELTVPHGFPDQLPRAKETTGRIRMNYEHVFKDGTLCVGILIEQRRVLAEQPTLVGFVDGLLVPYLYGYCFWQKHGRHPFGEAPHGAEGILDHYLATLGVNKPLAALGAIHLLYEHGYRDRQSCPCGSGRTVRKCHRVALRTLYNHHTPETLRSDFKAVFEACYQRFQRGQFSFPRPMRRKLFRLIEKGPRPQRLQ